MNSVTASAASAAESPSSEVFPNVPQEVVELCIGNRRAVLPLVVQAMRLAARLFAPAKNVSAEVDVDPDSDERRVVVNVTADLPPTAMLDRYRAYTREWVMIGTPALREWVRLSFHTPQSQ
jgi:hypothetical protein